MVRCCCRESTSKNLRTVGGSCQAVVQENLSSFRFVVSIASRNFQQSANGLSSGNIKRRVERFRNEEPGARSNEPVAGSLISSVVSSGEAAREVMVGHEVGKL